MGVTSTVSPEPQGSAFVANAQALARIPRALAYLHDALALSVVDGILSVAVPDPTDSDVIDALRSATRLPVRALAMRRDTIRAHLRVAYEPVSNTAGTGQTDAPAVRFVDAVLARAIAAHASDIHIEPRAGGGRIRMRVDGILRDLDAIPPELFAACTSRVKLLAAMDIADKRQPQDGRCSVPFEGREIDARVASVPTVAGEKIVVRLLDRYASSPALAMLGMPVDMLARYRAATAAPWGFIVVAGPTGSGKTTTLYASLAELDADARNVCSVEDPVEMRLAGVSQVQVNVRSGLSFPIVLRAFMRQDPNIVMVGEMRDGETASVAISAALAGQMVFTTLHANDAPRSLDRLIELGVSRHSLAAAVSAVVAQRLVRKLCERCRAREPLPAEVRTTLGIAADQWYGPRGCRACAGTGYLGRTGVYEILELDDAIRDAIATGSSSVHVTRLAIARGFRTMRDDAIDKVLAGVTSFDEVKRVVAWGAVR